MQNLLPLPRYVIISVSNNRWKDNESMVNINNEILWICNIGWSHAISHNLNGIELRISKPIKPEEK